MSTKAAFSAGAGYNPKFTNNSQHKLVKPEDVVETVEYAFTLNPGDQPNQSGLGVNEFKRWFTAQRISILNILGNYANIDLYPEISSKGRIHFHGFLTIKDIFNFYYKCVPRLMVHYSIEMDTIADRAVWKTYCTKQEEFVQPALHRELVSLTIEYDPDKYYHKIESPTDYEADEDELLNFGFDDE